MPFTFDKLLSTKRPTVKSILLSFISLQFILIAIIICIPVLLHIGTYGVHRIFVSHARHLGHITAPHKKILIWSDAFSSYKLPEVMEDSFHIYEQCDTPCSATTNEAFLNSSNAVLIHITDMDDVPLEWITSQYRILFNDQAKYLQHVERLKESGRFHLAINSLPRHLVVDKMFHDGSTFRVNYAENRYKDVIMLVENENEFNYYQNDIKQLSNYLSVDVYSVDEHHAICTPVADGEADSDVPAACMELLDKYRFIILPNSAFEDHYVTDRIRMAYNAKIVPVLLDIGADYTGILPNSSYVDQYSFKSVEALATDLVALRTDDERYNAHFNWIDKFELYETHLEEEICELCSYMRALDKDRRANY